MCRACVTAAVVAALHECKIVAAAAAALAIAEAATAAAAPIATTVYAGSVLWKRLETKHFLFPVCSNVGYLNMCANVYEGN